MLSLVLRQCAERLGLRIPQLYSPEHKFEVARLRTLAKILKVSECPDIPFDSWLKLENGNHVRRYGREIVVADKVPGSRYTVHSLIRDHIGLSRPIPRYYTRSFEMWFSSLEELDQWLREGKLPSTRLR